MRSQAGQATEALRKMLGDACVCGHPATAHVRLDSFSDSDDVPRGACRASDHEEGREPCCVRCTCRQYEPEWLRAAEVMELR